METATSLPGIQDDGINNLRWAIGLMIYLSSIITGIGFTLLYSWANGLHLQSRRHPQTTDKTPAPVEPLKPVTINQMPQDIQESRPHDQGPTGFNPGQIFNGKIHSQNLTINNGISPGRYNADQAVLLSQIQSLRTDLHTLAGYLRSELGNFAQNRDVRPPTLGDQSWWDFPQVNPGPGPWASSNFDPYSDGSDIIDDWGTDKEYQVGWGAPRDQENNNNDGINDVQDAVGDQQFEERPEETQTWYQERAVVDVDGINEWRDNTTEGQAFAVAAAAAATASVEQHSSASKSSTNSSSSSSQSSNHSQRYQRTQSQCEEPPVTPVKRPLDLFSPLSNHPSVPTTPSPTHSTYFHGSASGTDSEAPPRPRNSIFPAPTLQRADMTQCDINRSLQKELGQEQERLHYHHPLYSTRSDIHRDSSITVDMNPGSSREINQHINDHDYNNDQNINTNDDDPDASSQLSQAESEARQQNELQSATQTISRANSPRQSQSRNPSISMRGPDPRQGPQDIDTHE